MNADVTLDPDRRRIRVRSPYSPLLVERFRLIPGREFDGSTKTWSFFPAPDVLAMVTDVLGLLPWQVPEDVRTACGVNGSAAGQAPVNESVLDGMMFRTAPYAHQRQGLARLLANERWLIADEAGCGKSWIVANRLRCLPPDARTLILCPKSVLSVWPEQLWRHAGLECQVIQGNAAERSRRLDHPGLPIQVANYEQLLRPAAFLRQNWTVLVMDELHRCKNFCARTSRVVRELSERAAHVWGLSGTPAPNSLEDWHGVLAAVKPDLMPSTRAAFRGRYVTMTQLPSGVRVVGGWRNVAELHAKVQSIASRVTKAEALDLPAKTFLERRVTLTGEQARVYRDLKRDAVARLKTLRGEGTLTVQNILNEGLRLLQVVGGHFPTEDGRVLPFDAPAKLPALDDALDEIGSGKVVIWCCFVPEVLRLRQHLAKRGPAVAFHGSVNSADREAAVRGFQEGEIRYFVGTAACGGLGLTLTAASDAVYWSRDWSLTSWLQSADRIYRIGARQPVSITTLLADGTVDMKVAQALERKAGLQELLLASPEELF